MLTNQQTFLLDNCSENYTWVEYMKMQHSCEGSDEEVKDDDPSLETLPINLQSQDHKMTSLT